MKTYQEFLQNYTVNPTYQTRVAYFSMEYGIHQPLKIYSGGLGFLSGSHLRSAYDLKQNLVGVGILWKYGYYDQTRKADQTMDVLFQEKVYGFLQKTDIRFSIEVNRSLVWVVVYYLPPEVFGTAPLFLLSTDVSENDYLSKTITHKLYDANTEARIAASILLGMGGGKLLEILQIEPQIYHLNESHALPLAFYLYQKHKSLEEVKKRLVFTNHTPEEAGNLKTDIFLLERMGFFCGTPLAEIRSVTRTYGNILDHTVVALRMSKLCNAVSKMHARFLHAISDDYADRCPVISITNAQNKHYWADEELYTAMQTLDEEAFIARRKEFKRVLFDEIADQTGEMYDENVLTIVWARRFSGYKRPDLLLHDFERFHALVTQTQYPVQIIWAGKPYPLDYEAISVFDRLVHVSKKYPNCSVLVGYEMKLSKMLKQGADIWLNTPRITHEASGTSGMTAAMNGAINLSIPDGWIPEFGKHLVNSFLLPPNDPELPDHEEDARDAKSLYQLFEQVVLPMYYTQPDKWQKIQRASMTDVLPYFDSDRMADEYYKRLYDYLPASSVATAEPLVMENT